MIEQIILSAEKNYSELDEYINKTNIKKIFLVHDASLEFLKIRKHFDFLEKNSDVDFVRFSDFISNPLYESVVKGVELFNRESCDAVLAVGGGSAIDVAKCIKLYANMDTEVNYLKQNIVPNEIHFIAMPTTAGTGSEATRYAVIYYKGEKQSVTDLSCIPEAVLMDESVLETLPEYQKKATLLDAFCHAIESFWSINSTDESKGYSVEAINLIMNNKNAYLNNDNMANKNMLIAANIAGKAINITQTTAGHAMCYKLTSLYNIAHGHAAALCLTKLWMFMLNHTEQCVDLRGKEYVDSVFDDIATAMGVDNRYDAVRIFDEFVKSLELHLPKAQEGDYEILTDSVNPVRLKNNPVLLTNDDILNLYRKIV